MTRRTARRRSCSAVMVLPLAVTWGRRSTAAATSAVVVAVADANPMACPLSINPARNASRVAGSRIVMARAVLIAFPAVVSLVRIANPTSVGSISARPG